MVIEERLQDLFLEDSKYFIDILEELNNGTKDDYQLYLEGKIYCDNYERCYYDILKTVAYDNNYLSLWLRRVGKTLKEIKQYIEVNVNNDKRGYLINLRDRIKDGIFGVTHKYNSEHTEAADKGNPRALLNLGGHYECRGDSNLAFICYKRAWDERKYIPALYRLAIFYRGKEEEDKYKKIALEKSEEYCLLAIKKGYVKAYDTLIGIYWEQKDYEKSIRYYAEATIANVEITGIKVTELPGLLAKKYIEQNKRLKELEEENTHLRYRPGGVGMKEAKEHFEALLNDNNK